MHAPALVPLVVPALLLARPLAGQEAPAPRLDSVFSTDSVIVVRYTPSTAPGVRHGILRMDRSEGFWRRPRARTSARTERGWEDLGVVLGREYCYIVTARLPDQRSPTQSARGCAVHDGGDSTVRPPAAPQELTVTSRRTHGLALEFVDASDDETGFVLERRHADVSGWEEVRRLAAEDGVGRTVRHTDSGLEMEQRYCYRVRAFNASGDRVSNGVCEATEAAVVGEPLVSRQAAPALVRITHPREGELLVTWPDVGPDQGGGEWEATLTPLGGGGARSVRVRDRRAEPSGRWSALFADLDPERVYCASVHRLPTGRTAEPLCESPFARRRQPDDLGPGPADLPSVAAVERPDNGVLEVRLSNPRTGQLVDVVRAVDGRRWTDLGGRDGRSAFRLDRLIAGNTYCFRPVVTNRFGSRYGPLRCEETRADPPERPGPPRLDSVAGTLAHLAWTPAELADEYELSYEGTRPAYTDHEGTETGIRGTRTTFEMRPERSYCFELRARNGFGRSEPSSRLCDVSAGDAERVVTYRTDLVGTVPPEGPILYSTLVDPGPPAGARLRAVLVIGNAATPYLVKFVEPGSEDSVCSKPDGRVIEPGDTLDATDLKELYDAEEPTTPLALVACVARRDGTVELIERVPVAITYVRP
jgi:hypothetical protein